MDSTTIFHALFNEQVKQSRKLKSFAADCSSIAPIKTNGKCRFD